MIDFFLKASPTYKKNVATKKVVVTPRIQECFRYIADPSKPLAFIEGVVDEDIRKENKKAYDVFKKLVDEQQNDLYLEALSNMGAEIRPVIVEAAPQVIPFIFEGPIDLTEEMVVEEPIVYDPA